MSHCFSHNPQGVGRLYRHVSTLSILLATLGITAELHAAGEVRRSLWSLQELGPALLAAEPSALTTVGIWVLLSGPILGLLHLVLRGARSHSMRRVTLSCGVLAMVLVSLPIKACV